MSRFSRRAFAGLTLARVLRDATQSKMSKKRFPNETQKMAQPASMRALMPR